MKRVMAIAILTIFFFFPFQPALANEIAGYSAVLTNEALGLPVPDERVLILEAFLKNYQSPLESFAPFFIQMADKYQLDWRLVPSITGVESTFGKHIPYNSYNAYGWDNGNYVFTSWEESIEKVTATLKEKYVNRGLDNPQKIGPVYAPPSSTWASKVAYFMERIENFNQSSKLPDLTI